MSGAYSLRFRLLAGAVVSLLLALAIAGWVLSDLFQRHLRDRFDQELANHLDQLAANLGIDPEGRPILERPLSDPRFQRPLSGLYWQVAVDRAPLLRSRSLWDGTLELPVDSLNDGDLHRHLSHGPDNAPVIVVERSVHLEGAPQRFRLAAAEARSALDRAQDEFDRTLAVSLGMLTLVLALAAAVQVTVGLRPLARLRRELADIRGGRRKSFDAAVPLEVKPLVDDLNHLLAHSTEVVERARVQAGNLAHALKSGLAVIANELDRVAGAEAASLRERLDAMSRQVNHHLSRARAAAASGLPGWRTEVAPVVAALTRALGSLHADRATEVVIEVPAGLAFAGEREDLEELLGNLMDNACKWSAGRCRISARAAGAGRLTVTVEDNGPGLPEGSEAVVQGRGVRLDESVPGTGLGLGIVRDLCELYGGSLILGRSELGGLKAELILPAADS